MGRKKNLTEAELENTQTTLTIEDTNQAEAEEVELLAEEAAAEEAPIEVADVKPTEEEVKKPRRTRTRKPKEENNEKAVAEVSSPPSLTSEVEQWAAIKKLSEQVALILDKNAQPKIPAPSLDVDTIDFLKPQQPEPKTLFVTKFAVAASIVAVLLSLVSLSLSQSARQAVLGAADPIKQSGVAINPKRLK
jgi:hypothetical protein